MHIDGHVDAAPSSARGDAEISVGAALQRHDRLRARLAEQRHRRDGLTIDDAALRERNDPAAGEDDPVRAACGARDRIEAEAR